MNLLKALFIFIAITAFQVSAETAYRSVDKQGNVTFSDKPASGMAQEEQISIDAPPPSAESLQETQEREAALQKAASQAGIAGVPGEANQQKTAGQMLQDAEKRLEEARQVRAGDRIGTAGGGSRLTPEYLERVRKAEAEVERVREQSGETRQPD